MTLQKLSKVFSSAKTRGCRSQSYRRVALSVYHVASLGANVGVGSGNGFCASVFGAPVNAARAAIAFIDGTYRPMDLIRVEPEDSRDKSARLPYSFLHVSWGFVSDIGFDGERYRWLGRSVE